CVRRVSLGFSRPTCSSSPSLPYFLFVFSSAPPPPYISTLSLHDALPIFASVSMGYQVGVTPLQMVSAVSALSNGGELLEPRVIRSEEHTSELQSRGHLVCRLLLEKKKNESPFEDNEDLQDDRRAGCVGQS